MNRRSILRHNAVVFAFSVLLLVVVWQAVSQLLGIGDLISSPLAVVTYLAELVAEGEIWGPFLLTLERTAYAIVFAVVVGTAFGLVVGWTDFWKRGLEDYILVGLAFPPLLGAIIAGLWFGAADITAVVASGLLAFPYLSQTVSKAVEDVQGNLIKMSAAFDVSRRRSIHRTVLRSILPEWFAGFRYTFAVSWKVVTVVEVIMLGSGVGFRIDEQMGMFNMTGVLAWTFGFAAIVMFIEYGILQQIEKRVFDWRQETSFVGGGA